MNTQSPDLVDEHRRIVVAILQSLLPAGTAVWVFGSRVRGRARRHSDLDLAIDAGRILTLDETAQLREAFAESDLPYCVDLVDWRAVGDDFRGMIAAARLPLLIDAEP